mgnify:CR=1 FL=1
MTQASPKAREIRDWMDERAALGRPPGEDEVWDRIVSRYATMPTDDAETLLNIAMSLPPAPSARTSVAMWEVVNKWIPNHLDLVVPVANLPEFVADLARAAEALEPGRDPATEADAEAAPPAPGA